MNYYFSTLTLIIFVSVGYLTKCQLGASGQTMTISPSNPHAGQEVQITCTITDKNVFETLYWYSPLWDVIGEDCLYYNKMEHQHLNTSCEIIGLDSLFILTIYEGIPDRDNGVYTATYIGGNYTLEVSIQASTTQGLELTSVITAVTSAALTTQNNGEVSTTEDPQATSSDPPPDTSAALTPTQNTGEVSASTTPASMATTTTPPSGGNDEVNVTVGELFETNFTTPCMNSTGNCSWHTTQMTDQKTPVPDSNHTETTMPCTQSYMSSDSVEPPLRVNSAVEITVKESYSALTFIGVFAEGTIMHTIIIHQVKAPGVNSYGGLSDGAIAGIVIGCCVIVIVPCVVVIVCYVSKKKKNVRN